MSSGVVLFIVVLGYSQVKNLTELLLLLRRRMACADPTPSPSETTGDGSRCAGALAQPI